MTTSAPPFCWPCAHFVPSRVYRSPETSMSIGACAAYPDAIPAEIAVGVVDHRNPYTGDGGIVFEPRLDMPGWPVERITDFLDRKIAAAAADD